MSYGIDNLERADLKINLKSLYIICKKLLSISYQHNAAPVCGHIRSFWQRLEIFPAKVNCFLLFLTQYLSKVKMTLLTSLIPHGQIFQNFLPNHCFLPIISSCHILIRHMLMPIGKIISMTKDSGNQEIFFSIFTIWGRHHAEERILLSLSYLLFKNDNIANIFRRVLQFFFLSKRFVLFSEVSEWINTNFRWKKVGMETVIYDASPQDSSDFLAHYLYGKPPSSCHLIWRWKG